MFRDFLHDLLVAGIIALILLLGTAFLCLLADLSLNLILG